MSNKLIYLLVAVLLVLTIGLAAGFMMMWNKLAVLNTQGNLAANQGVQQAQAAAPGPLFSLETFIVNLADEQRNRYLRVTMDLALADSADADMIKERLSQVRDSILMILPSKQFAEIASMEGKIALRDEIIARLNGLFNKKVVTNIFFTEFVVQ
ncbi:MAG: flagellar basal body-associated FliL family protein [Desulfobacterales bacterium]|jgi:flagellar FliL protein